MSSTRSLGDERNDNEMDLNNNNTLKTILVVDDSELLHRMYDLILRRYHVSGTRILHARNGAEALAMIRVKAIDVMLLDVNMPVMSGTQLIVGLRASNLLSNLKVIMVSTEGREEDIKVALQNGAIGYVTKPFTPVALHSLIERHFPTEAPPGSFSSPG